MSIQAYFGWFKENWARVAVVLVVFLTLYLVVIVLPQDRLLFALMMFTPLYMLHQVDECVSPGKFEQFLNKNIYKTDPINGLLDVDANFWINLLVWLFFALSGFQAMTDLSEAGWMPYFVIFQAVIHLIIGIAGKQFFNPGMLTSWFVHVPWAIWTISLLMKSGLFTNPYWNGYMLSGLYITLAMPVAGFALWIRYKRKLKQ